MQAEAGADPGVTYVVACTPRTGSSLLCTALADTAVAGAPDEHLRPDREVGWHRVWGLTEAPRDVRAWAAAAREATTTPNGVFGEKLHWYQFVHLLRELRRFAAGPGRAGGGVGDRALVAGLLGGDPVYVHLRREDTAAQALSYYRAIYSGRWSIAVSAPPNRGLVPDAPDLGAVRWLEDLLVAHDGEWRRWFEAEGITPLELTYEQLDTDLPGALVTVLDHIGVPSPPGPAAPVRLRRQADRWSARWLAAYRAARSSLEPQPPGGAWADLDRLTPRVTTRVARAALDRPATVEPPTVEPPTVRYSCVVDRAPIFLYQSLVWVLSLLHLGGQRPEDLVVHAVDGVPDDHVELLRSLGVEVVPVAPFDPRSPFGNKLRQLTSTAFDGVDVAVLCDCDLAFSDDMTSLVPQEGIGAKVVDAGFPAYNVWVRLVRLAGLPETPPLARATQTMRWTALHNLNGGLLTVPVDQLPVLAEAWPRWLWWVLDHAEGFGRKVTHHAFQISFGLTVAELDLPVTIIPTQLNFSTMPPQTEIAGPDPFVLHYHRRLNADGLVVPTGVPSTDRSIQAVNSVLRGREGRRLLAPAVAAWRASLDPT